VSARHRLIDVLAEARRRFPPPRGAAHNIALDSHNVLFLMLVLPDGTWQSLGMDDGDLDREPSEIAERGSFDRRGAE
jgi:hypothetical protein